MEDLLQQAVAADDLSQLTAPGAYEEAAESVDFQLIEQIDALLDTLDEQTQSIVQMCFGLDGSAPLEVEEVAQRLHMDAIEVEEYIHSALAQLRAPALVAV